MPKRNSNGLIWDFFEKSGAGDKTAFCNYCSKKLSYQTTITNLKHHLERQHKSEYIILSKLTQELTKQIEFSTTLRNKVSKSKQNAKKAFNTNLLIWNSFAKSFDGSKTVTCNYCSNTLSYINTIDNLKAHLKIKHKEEYNKLLNLTKQEKSATASEKSTSDDEGKEFKFESEEVGNVPSTADEEKEDNIRNDSNSDLPVWNFFEKSNNDDSTATCNDCGNSVSYETSIANLEEHLKVKHISQYNNYLDFTKQPEPLSMHNNSTSDTEKQRETRTDEPIWKFYTRSDSSGTAFCNYCDITLSYTTSITNLEEHLKDQHDSEYNSLLNLTKQLESDPPFEDFAYEIEETENLCNSLAMSEEEKEIWNFFECHNDNIAVCNFCSHELSYNHSIANLKLHLKINHITEYNNFSKALQLEAAPKDVREKSERKENRTSFSGILWNFFEKLKHGNNLSSCNYCSKELSYNATIGNLKKHLRRKHAEEYEIFSNLSNELATKTPEGTKMRNLNNLRIWHYFEKSKRGDRIAICKYCNKKFSCSTITNLKTHLKRKHIGKYREFVKEERPTSINRRRLVSMSDRSTTPESEIGNGGYPETDEDAGEEQVQDPEIEDVWNYFEKIPPNKAQCILCKETFQRYVPFLTKHMKEKHRKVAWDHSSDSDEDQNVYTEVVYLEEEEQPPSVVTKSKHTKQAPVTKKRRLSSRYEFVNKPKEAGNTPKTDEIDEEIENFGRYVIGLLKKMPKDVSTQLQMDIISMIMKAKLKLETTTNETVSASVSNVTDGVIVTPSNVIVTTPSNVIHTTQNNESLPTLVIGVENES
ncbi:uncharacterized protein LOC123878317 isoform X1 [Maniola jurtina]|uniref:uncharacterized protein LOC123878317 isoform X1 n=1 Tax=Maniola jurtina TaxID=191418 RepID=UPI001E6891FA|nr:uncharacterized protein LOC123878317 isoform X1 [Maniola jurtina]XP_045781436.1 uncharacterized protein LOC123878317 isoform X1 [Maniola jurtina]XP_045781437.1 uncharacterized protein LOC123878317 isoform X1 [Maniola jurtina]